MRGRTVVQDALRLHAPVGVEARDGIPERRGGHGVVHEDGEVLRLGGVKGGLPACTMLRISLQAESCLFLLGMSRSW